MMKNEEITQKIIGCFYTVRVLVNEHEAQLLNYLNATGFEVGLLLNFGPQAQVKRKVFDNNRKKYLSSRMDTD